MFDSKTFKVCCLFASMTVLGACVSNPATVDSTSPKQGRDQELIQNYSLGDNATTAVGQAMIEKGERFYIDMSSEQLMARVSRQQGGYKIAANEQYAVRARDNTDGGFYVGGSERKDVAVKIDEQGRLLSQHMFYLREGQWQENTIFQVGEAAEQLFEAIETKRELAPQSHREVLLYQGLEADSIKLEYRAYKGDAVEPSDSEVISFNVAQHNIIRFRSYRFQIKSADDQQIKYIVLTD